MRFVTYAILALALLAAPALAQDEPADSAIKNALYDIERAEADLPGLTPSRGANIKRMQRMLGLTRQRLEGSANKDHASYLDAEARLTRLEQALGDLAEGRMPGEGAAPHAAEAAEEAPAGPVDPAIAAAEREIARIAGELDGVTASDTALIKRYRIQLDQVAQRLNQISAKDDPAWRAAATSYNVQNERLNSLVAQGADAQTPVADTPEQAPDTPVPADVAAAAREMARIGGELTGVTASDKALIKRYRMQLDMVGERLAGFADKSNGHWRIAAGNYNSLNEQLNALVAAANAAGGGAVPAPAAAEGGNQADNDAIARAERELGMIERQMGDIGKADRFLNDLSRIAQELDDVEDKTTPQWTAFAEHFGAVRTGIVDGVAAKLLDDLNRTIDAINRLQPLQYLITEDVEGVRDRLRAVNDSANALQSNDLPSVQRVLVNFARIAKAFEERVAAAEAEHAQLGDVNGELAAIDQRVRTMRVPQALTAEAGEAEIRAFAEAAGIGYIGRNTCIITEEFGSWVFLAVIITDLDLPADTN